MSLKIDFTNELLHLLYFSGSVALEIRNYSSHNRGVNSTWSQQDSYNLKILSDSLCELRSVADSLFMVDKEVVDNYDVVISYCEKAISNITKNRDEKIKKTNFFSYHYDYEDALKALNSIIYKCESAKT